MEECPSMGLRVWHWGVRVGRLAIEYGLAPDRVKATWGGVILVGRRYVRILWTRPVTAQEVVGQATEQVVVWPVILGIGPIRGVATALSRLGLKEPHQFMLK